MSDNCKKEAKECKGIMSKLSIIEKYMLKRNKIPYNTDEFSFRKKWSKKSNYCEEIIKQTIHTKKLDEKKIENISNLIESINSRNTIVTIKGEQGSGKTSVIKIATQEIFLPKKGSLNFIFLILLFLSLWMPPIFLITRIRKRVLREIALRRWKYINMNMWNIFGHRQLSEYKEIGNTAYLNKITKIKAGKENTYERISSFQVKDNGDKDDKASWLFIKKAIWRTIFSKISIINPFISRLKNSIFLNTYSIYKEKAKLKIVLFNVLSILLITLLFAIPFYTLGRYGMGKEWKEAIEFSFISLAPGVLVQIIIVYSIKSIKIYSENVFFVDPISNTAIQKYINKISKHRVILIHISELDRLNEDVGDDSFIKYIIESISLGYMAPNVNIIFEINNNILEIVSKKWDNTIKNSEETNSKNKDILLDRHNKIFSKIINVRSFNLDALLKYHSLEGLEKILFTEFYKNISMENSIKSWRNEDELFKIFIDVNKKLKLELIKNTNNINLGFFDIYKPSLFNLMKRKWKNTNGLLEVGDEKLEIDFGTCDDTKIINTIFYLFNPHINKKNDIVYFDSFKEESYLELFAMRLCRKIPKDYDIIKNKLTLLILNFLSKEYFINLPEFNYASFWSKVNIYPKEIFSKIREKEQRKILNYIELKNTIKNNTWVAEYLNKFIDFVSDDVFERYIENFTNNKNDDEIKPYYLQLALKFNTLDKKKRNKWIGFLKRLKGQQKLRMFEFFHIDAKNKHSFSEKCFKEIKKKY